MTDQQLEELCIAIQNNYGFTSEQIHTVFTNYFRTINPKLTTMLDEKIELFNDFLQMSKEESVQLFVQHHFLIPASLDKIKETIQLLLSESRNYQDDFLSKDRIKQILRESP